MGLSYFVAAADGPGLLMAVLCLGWKLVSLRDRRYALCLLLEPQDELTDGHHCTLAYFRSSTAGAAESETMHQRVAPPCRDRRPHPVFLVLIRLSTST
jgi:hypothetical protein